MRRAALELLALLAWLVVAAIASARSCAEASGGEAEPDGGALEVAGGAASREHARLATLYRRIGDELGARRPERTREIHSAPGGPYQLVVEGGDSAWRSGELGEGRPVQHSSPGSRVVITVAPPSWREGLPDLVIVARVCRGADCVPVEWPWVVDRGQARVVAPAWRLVGADTRGQVELEVLVVGQGVRQRFRHPLVITPRVR